MAGFMDKLPDLNEIGSMAGKLFKDVKLSVSEIIDDYKTKHPQKTANPSPAPTKKPTSEGVVKPESAEPKKAKAPDEGADKKNDV